MLRGAKEMLRGVKFLGLLIVSVQPVDLQSSSMDAGQLFV
jgi:hypothetical protein